jgi:hypothetical protein
MKYLIPAHLLGELQGDLVLLGHKGSNKLVEDGNTILHWGQPPLLLRIKCLLHG